MRKVALWFCIVLCVGLALAHRLSGRTMVGEILEALWPLYLLVGGGAAIACLVLNAPKQIGWPGTLATLIAAGFLMGVSRVWEIGVFHPPAYASAPEPDQLSVVTFNTWARNQDFEAAVDYLLAGDFDLISAQEIGRNTRPLPSRLRPSFPYQFTCGRGVYVFSRRPFTATGCPHTGPQTDLRIPAAWVDVEWRGQTVRFVALHLARPMEMHWRRPQISRLAAFIAANPDRSMILTGDFNTSHNGRSAQAIADQFSPLTRRDARYPSWPSDRLGGVPLLALDQIWLSPDLCLASSSVGPAIGSDHRPITGRIEACSGR